MKDTIKHIAIILLSTILSGTIIALLLYHFRNPSNLHFNEYLLNSVFIVNIVVVCVSVIALVSESGLFNGMIYSVRQFNSTVFNRSKNELMSANGLKDSSEIKEFLKEKYLYKKRKYKYTYPLVISSFSLLFILLIYINIAYGI